MSQTREHHTEFAGGVVGYLEQDSDCTSPLSDDSDAVKFVVLHRRYTNPAEDVGNTPEDVKAWARANAKEWQEYPLYMYDHSGTVYAITPFSCRWDSGRVGSIFMKKSEFPRGTRKRSAKGIAETYTQWANGDCWGYVIEDRDGDELDSCWGFIGQDYALEQMKEMGESHAKEVVEEQAAATAKEMEESRPDMY